MWIAAPSVKEQKGGVRERECVKTEGEEEKREKEREGGGKLGVCRNHKRGKKSSYCIVHSP